MVKNIPVNSVDTGETGLIPGLGRTPGGGNGNPLQYSCWENPLDRGAWQVTVWLDMTGHTHISYILRS